MDNRTRVSCGVRLTRLARAVAHAPGCITLSPEQGNRLSSGACAWFEVAACSNYLGRNGLCRSRRCQTSLVSGIPHGQCRPHVFTRKVVKSEELQLSWIDDVLSPMLALTLLASQYLDDTIIASGEQVHRRLLQGASHISSRVLPFHSFLSRSFTLPCSISTMDRIRNQMLPKSGEIYLPGRGEKAINKTSTPIQVDDNIDKEIAIHVAPLAATPKGRWERTWPVIACGSGLFSDGYVNGVIGSVNTMLRLIYDKEYTESRAQSNVSAIAFAGAVVGSLVFGYTSDHWSRKNSLLVSTVIIVVFSALGAGAYGVGTQGLFAALTAYRFFLGVGIGGEYPAGSVACGEATGELKKGHRNRWFIFSTDFAIDTGFVVAAFVPMVVVLATSENHLRAAWRICLGLGVIPPLSLLYLRIKLKEPEAYARGKLNKYPYWLIFKLYWWRLLVVSIIWFLYDFSAYSFGIYSSSWLQFLVGDNPPLWQTFGWNT